MGDIPTAVMFKFVIFGMFISFLQNTFSLSVPVTYEYNPPSIKGSHIFLTLLDPKAEVTESVAQFMYFYKHSMYASAFLSETFLLGLGNTHIFDGVEVDLPYNELRRISIAVGRVWTQLHLMRTINRITRKYSIDTSHYFLQSKDRSDTLRYLFHGLEEAIKSDQTLSAAYNEERQKLEFCALPPLKYANISLSKFVGIEKKLDQRVWNDSGVFSLIAHARFSQHVEVNIENVTEDDCEEVVSAHALVDMAMDPELRQDAQNVYNETILETVETSFDILKNRNYTEFDRALFKRLNNIMPKYPLLNDRYKLVKISCSSLPFLEMVFKDARV